jgi:hypothetical protein
MSWQGGVEDEQDQQDAAIDRQVQTSLVFVQVWDVRL